MCEKMNEVSITEVGASQVNVVEINLSVNNIEVFRRGAGYRTRKLGVSFFFSLILSNLSSC